MANMGLIWGRQDPGGPHVGPLNFAVWDVHHNQRWEKILVLFHTHIKRKSSLNVVVIQHMVHFTQIYDTDTTINISNVKFEDEVRKFYAFHMQPYTAKLVWMLFPYFPWINSLVPWRLRCYNELNARGHHWWKVNIGSDNVMSLWSNKLCFLKWYSPMA